MKYKYGTLVGSPSGRDHYEDLDIDGRISLQPVLNK
jgi:hypothetical protein